MESSKRRLTAHPPSASAFDRCKRLGFQLGSIPFISILKFRLCYPNTRARQSVSGTSISSSSSFDLSRLPDYVVSPSTSQFELPFAMTCSTDRHLGDYIALKCMDAL